MSLVSWLAASNVEVGQEGEASSSSIPPTLPVGPLPIHPTMTCRPSVIPSSSIDRTSAPAADNPIPPTPPPAPQPITAVATAAVTVENSVTSTEAWDLVVGHISESLQWLEDVPLSCRCIYVYHFSSSSTTTTTIPENRYDAPRQRPGKPELIWIASKLPVSASLLVSSSPPPSAAAVPFVWAWLMHVHDLQHEMRLASPTDYTVFGCSSAHDRTLYTCRRMHSSPSSLAATLTHPAFLKAPLESASTCHAFVCNRMLPSVVSCLAPVCALANQKLLSIPADVLRRAMLYADNVSPEPVADILACLIPP